MKKMHIRIDSCGKTTIAVDGGNGADCIEFTALVESALGRVEKRVLSEEYDQSDIINITENITLSEDI